MESFIVSLESHKIEITQKLHILKARFMLILNLNSLPLNTCTILLKS